MKMKLTGKMVVYFLLVILVAVVGFSYTIYHSNSVEDAVGVLGETDIPRMEKNYEIAYNAMAETANIRAYFMYGSEQYLNEYKRVAELNAKLEEDLFQTARFGEEKRLATELKAENDKYSAIADTKIIPLIQAGKHEEALQVFSDELAPQAGVLLAKADENKQIRKNMIAKSVADTKTSMKQAQMSSIIAAVIAAMLGLAIAVFAARRMAAPIKELQNLMAEASQGNLLVKATVRTQDEIGQLCESFNTMMAAQTEIVTSVKNSAVELTAASEEMAASSTEVASAVSHIAKETQDVAESMSDASKSSTETAEVLVQLSSLIQIAKDKAASASVNSDTTIAAARGGKVTVEEAMQSMTTIHAKTLEAEKVITLLSEYSKKIGIINETISGIAKQTNLLALNAAIEAARAGETGRGFAVVAEEVRKLAEQSNTEADNISQLIGKITDNTGSAVVAMKHSLTEVEVGVEAVNKAEKSLENILAAVAETVHDINGIAKVTDDEVASSDKIVQLIESMANDIERTERDAQDVSAATEEVTATMETVAASSEQTSAMAQNMQHEIIKFQI